jgi:hypothetical protein
MLLKKETTAKLEVEARSCCSKSFVPAGEVLPRK